MEKQNSILKDLAASHRYSPVKVQNGEVSVDQNHEIVGERKVILERVRVKERPDQAAQVFRDTGKMTTPVHVIALLKIIDSDSEEEKAMWPVNLIENTQGLWWSSMEAWEQDRDDFMKHLEDEMLRLRFKTKENINV